MAPHVLSPRDARTFLVGHHGLRTIAHRGFEGVRALLAQMQHIQLDPLDPMGTNADLVALARVDGIAKGDVYRALLPGYAFEHFAKERCLLPASAFPFYRDRFAGSHWWKAVHREQRLPPGVVDLVFHEVRERGPASARELRDHGRVVPIDYAGWKGTGSATSMALEVLWAHCRVVVCGRDARGAKRFDIPERALPQVASAPSGDFARWALLTRVEACGFLSRKTSAAWSILDDVRKTDLPERLVAEGLLEEISVAGSSRVYLAPAGFRDRAYPRSDARMRILGPLDPLLWDRALVLSAFGFEYVWEVYKPKEQRRWGWYVCPLLHRGALVGRLEGSVDGEVLHIRNIWRERDAAFDETALAKALARHAKACGASRVKMPRRIRVSD